MRTNKLSAAIILVLAPWMAGQALADCRPVPTAGDDVIVCDDAVGGADTDGVNGGAGNDTITIVAGSSVSSTTSDAVTGGAGSDTIVNHGTLSTNGNELHAIRQSDGNDTILHYGHIETYGFNSTAIFSAVDHDHNRVHVDGDILTHGENSEAIILDGDSGIVDVQGGRLVRTHGADAMGIWMTGADNVLINHGSVETVGDNSNSLVMIGAFGPGADDNDIVENHGAVRTSGADSIGIVMSVSSGSALRNMDFALVETTGDRSHGIVLRNSTGSHVANDGQVDTHGAGADGIRVTGDGTVGVNSIAHRGILTGAGIETRGADSDGISVAGDDHSILVGSGAWILTHGGIGTADSADRLVAGAQGIEVVGNRNQASIADATIATAGASAHGVRFTGDNNSATMSGRITTTGGDAAGMSASGSDNQLSNQGSITTAGIGSHGIHAAGDNTRLLTSGSIATSGTEAHGILANGIGNAVQNGGNIGTGGDGARGIMVFGTGIGTGATDVYNNGVIDTLGVDSDAFHVAGDRFIIGNGGHLGTSGGDADGIEVAGNQNRIMNYSTGVIATAGGGAAGMMATGNDNVVENEGAIATSGDGASGIFQVSGTGNSIVNAGTIATAAFLAPGIDVRGSGNALSNTGAVSTIGRSSAGMLTASGGNNALSNIGSITTAADYSYGMMSVGDGNALLNTGTIRTRGLSAHGMFAIGGGNTLTNSGRIEVIGGEGVTLQGSGNTLHNSGAIIASGRPAAVQLDSGSTSTIGNSGMLSSAEECISGTAAGATTITSSGSMECGRTAVWLGAGDDLVTLVDGSITHGDIQLGDGTDGVVLDVGTGLAGRLNGSIGAAESLHKDGAGLFTIDGNAEVGYTSAHVNAGTLQLVDGVLTGNTHVAAGATLVAVRYAFNGDVENAGALLSEGGILAIDGDFIQSASGTLQLYTDVSGSDSSRIQATGTASLDGHVDITLTDPGSLLLGYNDIVLVEAAGGRSGEFASFSDNLVDTIDTALAYTPSQALLRITLPPEADSMLGFTMGTAHAGQLAGRVLDQRLRVLEGSRLAESRGKTDATHQGPWAQYYTAETTFGDPGEIDWSDVDTNGGLVGIDFVLGQSTTVGVVAGASDASTTTGAAQGTTRGLLGGAYASHGFNRGYLEAIATYGTQEYRIQRRTLAGTIAESTHDGDTINVRIGAGFQIREGVTVFDQIAYDHVNQDGFGETGAAGFAQQFDADRFESLRNRAGLRFTRFDATAGGTPAATWLELGWVHDFRIDQAQFITRPADAAGPVTVAMADKPAANGFDLRTGVSWLGERTVFSLQANFERRGGMEDWGLAALFGWTFR